MSPFSSTSRLASHAAVGRQYPWAVPVVSVLLAIILFVGSAIYFAYTRLDGNIQSQDIEIYLDRETETPLEPYKPGDDINFLILGSDVREGEADIDGAGESGDVVGMRSDTTMLAHISADRSRVEIVSIPRDTLVDIPSCRLPDGTWTAPQTSAIFNSAFSIGGQTDDVGAAAACTIRTVEGMSGLFIDGFVVVDFASFQQFVDALGGVEMCFEEDLADSMAGLDISAGCQTLDGEQALAFARARKGIGDGSDIGRMQRQQELVLAIAEDALSRNILTDLPSLYRLVDAVSQSIVTDAQLGNIDTLASLANSIRGVSTEDIFLMTMPWDPAGARVLPAAESEILWEALRDDIALSTIFDDNGEVMPTDVPTETATATVDQTQEAE
ncbi:LytR family transcriptional regulator [Flaviflexus salsibiostraticola]|uniref:LytR family transcriptional regulator n=1 Tax=Flaviflexus salsibiostraticola TaxID=1282737 RepID=A0A3Q8WV55_9ACTO|nr:LCP family protein [Flaviflexus salsibiostraticola]AZN30830.1 LytR family transcriptional regulator [Flaviflexus salsibiostraticola]